MAEFTTRMRVIKLVAKSNKCAMYFELGKNNTVPTLEVALSGVSHTTDQDKAVDKRFSRSYLNNCVSEQREVIELHYRDRKLCIANRRNARDLAED